MIKKSMFVLSILMIASLVLGPAARAQSPGATGQTFRPAAPASAPGAAPSFPGAAASQALLSRPAAASSALLGQPGTAFRYVKSLGVTGRPYISDNQHLNRPRGLFMDGSGNLFLTEEQGKRVLKYNSSGQFQFSIGKAGVCITDDYKFCVPNDVVVAAGGNIWVADGNRVVEYDSTGSYLQQFPNDQPWMSGAGNDRFDQAQGLAFDSAGRLYVSDSNNHRVQVFDMTSGSPVYSTTIGTAGTPGSGVNQFARPYHIAIDHNDRLLVIDQGNNRVQACTYLSGWSCSTLDGGYGRATGITVDASNTVFISDNDRGIIRKCTSGGCSNFGSNVWLEDLAVDGSGNVYGANSYADVVIKLNSSGSMLGNFLGDWFVPYLTDQYHYNHPRVAVDKDNNIILAEENGNRLIKLNSQGTPLWEFGVPGLDANDDTHLMWPGGVATDLSGNIYVANNTQVKVFTPAGALSATFGAGSGTGNYQFGRTTGIAVDKYGTIYVTDGPNHRIQVYNSSHTYVTHLGETGVKGGDDTHFAYPQGLAVDAEANLYVADNGNCRVQKFNSSLVHMTTFGTGSCWGGLTDINPTGVAVDAQGRVYVSEWNNRVTVFDASGGYLTTVGGNWGSGPAQFTGATSAAVDGSGNLLVSDNENARVEVFASGVTGWKQSNLNGFGDINNVGIWSLGIYSDTLYASTYNYTGSGTQLWKLDSSNGWIEVMGNGFGDGSNQAIDHMLAFKGYFYAGTANCSDPNCSSWTGGQLWRSNDGTLWNPITKDAFGNPSMAEIFRLAVLDGQICASTWDYASTPTGAQIWCSASGDSDTWAKLADNGFGASYNVGILSMLEFNGSSYAGTLNTHNGAQVWRKTGAGSWTQVNTDGFGNSLNMAAAAMEVFNNQLYVIVRSNAKTDLVYRCTLCDNTDWQEVGPAAFKNPIHEWPAGLAAAGGKLYAAVSTTTSFLEVWQTSDGVNWGQSSWSGFGDIGNMLTYWGNAMLGYKGQLVVGTLNFANGAEIWQTQDTIFVPVIRK